MTAIAWWRRGDVGFVLVVRFFNSKEGELIWQGRNWTTYTG